MDDDDGWVSLAMSNELLVANLLLHLRHDTLPSPPPPRSTRVASPVLDLRWTAYQPRSTKRRSKYSTERRSESSTKMEGAAAAAAAAGKKEEPVSPSTPLSWNGSTCNGGAVAVADDRDDTPVDSSRPEVGDQSDTATAKRSRRKRTLAELEEEESLLLKQKTDLENELASLNHTVERYRATNESLKRMKLNLESRQILQIGTTSMVSGKAVLDPPQLAEAPCHPSKSVSSPTVKDKVLDGAVNASSKQEPLFLLPDLNLPVGEDFDSHV